MAFTLTPGQASDLGQAEPLIEDVDMGALLADKACDADGLVETLTQRRSNCSPPRSEFPLDTATTASIHVASWTSEFSFRFPAMT